MIKTDKVIYHTRTLEEYDWLMKKLDEEECTWATGRKLTKFNAFHEYRSNCCLCLRNKTVQYSGFDFYNDNPGFKYYEFIEVSDLMKNEEKKNLMKTDKVIYHVKTVKEYDWLMRNLKTKDIQLPAKTFHSEPDLGVLLKNGIVLIDNYTFFQKSKNYNNNKLDHIEVSGIMKDEEVQKILETIYNAYTIEVRFE